MIPMITLLAMSIPNLVGGATLTETVFAWNGIGSMTYNSVMNKDYSVAMASLMFSAIMVVIGNLLADILYAVVDPRVRYD
jgi:peptide/nickel transport system permease protein